ncbi:MAG: hypothetical protein RIS44_1863 [Pseudomonadota bacterium]|jgi:hypothetical protein
MNSQATSLPETSSLRKIFLCVRWGNAGDEEGADGQDTYFVVTAFSHDEAAILADEVLSIMPTHNQESGRSVEPFCHRVLEIGSDDQLLSAPAVLFGPMIGYALRSASNGYRGWCRGEIPGEFSWRRVEDVFGEQR